MMAKKFVVISAFVALSLGFVGVALALNPYSNGTVYFDENGQVVGQQVLTCDGQASHGGNTHTTYHVSTSVYCGWGGCCTPGEPCSGLPKCPGAPNYIVPDTYITEYVLPSFESIQQACALMGSQCEVPPERMLDKGWTWSYGWN